MVVEILFVALFLRLVGRQMNGQQCRKSLPRRLERKLLQYFIVNSTCLNIYHKSMTSNYILQVKLRKNADFIVNIRQCLRFLCNYTLLYLEVEPEALESIENFCYKKMMRFSCKIQNNRLHLRSLRMQMVIYCLIRAKIFRLGHPFLG